MRASEASTSADGLVARPLLQPRQIVHRHAREPGDLLAAKTVDATMSIGRDTNLSGVTRSRQARRQLANSLSTLISTSTHDCAPIRELPGPGGPRESGPLVIAPREAHDEPMTTTLITGANKGLGYEAARRLLAEGHDVWVAARNAEHGQRAAEELRARFVQLDVTSQASITAAAATVDAQTGLDVLINNAGIAGSYSPISELSTAEVEQVYDTNVFGAIRVTQAFIPLLQRSPAPVIVNVSSGLGSETLVRDPERVESSVNSLAYCSSKAALIMITTQYAKGYPGIRVNVVDPGYTATDLNHHSGPQTVQEGTDQIIAMATISPDGPTVNAELFEAIEIKVSGAVPQFVTCTL